jgi:hypothetical protein
VLFTKDSNDHVVVPLENMLRKVERIRNNPLEAALLEEEEEVCYEEFLPIILKLS